MSDLFVGRAQELRLLRTAASDASEGRGRLVLLGGEPGIGKSRLADEFARSAVAGGTLVAWGRCWELGGAPAYWPWTEALRDVSAQRATTDTSALSQLLPELQDARTAATAVEHADAARFRLFDGVARYLRAVTEDSPLVVVLEDIHAADEPSLLLLQFLVRALPNLRVLVVATYRDVGVIAASTFPAALFELMRDRATTRTVLVGLTAPDVGEMIAATTGAAAPDDVVERVRIYTEGNPLYVREVARLLTADGHLAQVGDRLVVPGDVREALLLRVRQLPDNCCEALTLAAVIGRDFSLDLLTRIRGEAAVEALQPAVGASLIIPGDPGRLRFSHAVVSEALYDATPPAQRLHLHRDIAEALEKLPATSAETHLASIAHHYHRALPLSSADKTVAAARRAAQAAVARLAYEEGARLYRIAIDAMAHGGDAQSYNELLLGLGDAQRRAGATAGSRATFLAAADRLRETDDDDLFAEAALGYAGGFVWMRAADDERVVLVLKEALDRLPPDAGVRRVQVLARLAGAKRDEADLAPRDALSREALDIARRLGDPNVLVYALASRFCAIWGPDGVDEGRRVATEAIAIAEAIPDRERLGEALMTNMLIDMTAGEMDAAREATARYRRYGEQQSEPSIIWYAMVLEAVFLLMEGRLAQAEQLIDDAHDLGARVQAWDSEASYRLGLAMLRWEQGRITEVEGEIRDALARFPGYRVFRCMLALCNLESGRVTDAVAATEEILAGGAETLPHSNDWLSGMSLLAEVATRADMRHVASAMYDALLPYASCVGTAGGEPVTGSVHRPLGQLAALLGRDDDAQEHFERALAVHTRMRAELWIARSEIDLAEVLWRSDAAAVARADQLRSRALHRSESLGLPALTARVRASKRATVAAGPRPGGLTKREVEVAALVAKGASNRGIADALVISERTAESHVQNILTKLGFSARTQIAAWAVAANLGTGT
jgi:ATP/maltotriose-dependent transcriptional regulator MalT